MGQVQYASAYRQEVDVAAEVIATLVSKGVIANKDLALALKLTQVTFPAYVEARTRLIEQGYTFAPLLDETGTKVCSNCEKEKPVTAFHRDGERRRGQCRDCVRDIHKRRYLTVKQTKLLNTVNLMFTVQDGDETVDVICTSCHRPFAVGDKVCGKTKLKHEDCP